LNVNAKILKNSILPIFKAGFKNYENEFAYNAEFNKMICRSKK